MHFVSHTIFLSHRIAWNTLARGRVVEARVRWTDGYCPSSCASLVSHLWFLWIPVNSPYEHVAGGFFFFFLVWSVREACFPGLEMGQGINSIPRGKLVNRLGAVEWIIRAKHSRTLSGATLGYMHASFQCLPEDWDPAVPTMSLSMQLFCFPFLPYRISLFPSQSFLGLLLVLDF